MFAHVHATGAGYFAHAGNWIRLANQSELAAAGVDSASVTALVDSNYVQARQANASPGATTINTTTITATAGQTVFSVNYTVDKLNVYLNGILLDPTDYTATNGTSITLDVAASVNDIINIITYDTVAVGTPTINTFEYTATANQTTFTGSDDNSAILEYTADKLNVYLNGILLAAADYTATNGSSVVLATAAAASDVVSITAYKPGSVGKLDSDGVGNLIDSAYIQARQTTQDFAFSSLTGTPTTIAGYGITDAFDGAYSSLTGTPTIPTNNNELTNGAGYLTTSDLTNYRTATQIESMIDSNVSAVIDGAPGALDTLNE